MIHQIKFCLSKVNSFGKFLYNIFYAIPVRAYKIRICPAINEFKIDTDFQYKEDSYYPAIMKKNPKKADQIYKRVVTFDNNGIPLLELYEQKYWPVTIAQYGLLNYNFYQTYRKESYKEHFLKVCDWLCDNISSQGMWEHRINYHCTVVEEDIAPPYGSAMVQGEGISVLVRGFLMTRKQKYLDVAAMALNPYCTYVEDGGVLRNFMGLPFYEEYPTKTPSLVLNGFMFALFGLYDFSKMPHAENALAEKLFNDGIATLEKLLPMYEGGYCSRYSLSHITKAPMEGLKNPFYHPIHVNQLIALQSVAPSEVFAYYIKKWR